jgi:hypothetical protein
MRRAAAVGKDLEAKLRNKISQGGFTGAFLIQCFVAMGVTSLRLEDSLKPLAAGVRLEREAR